MKQVVKRRLLDRYQQCRGNLQFNRNDVFDFLVLSGISNNIVGKNLQCFAVGLCLRRTISTASTPTGSAWSRTMLRFSCGKRLPWIGHHPGKASCTQERDLKGEACGGGEARAARLRRL